MSWKKKGLSVSLSLRRTVVVDAAGRPVGRLATEIARLLMGKDQPIYTPHIDSGALVEVKNIGQMVFTGNKLNQKVLFRSSNRPGGIKRVPVSELMQTDPARVLKHAVEYMLPKNRTQQERLKRLVIV